MKGCYNESFKRKGCMLRLSFYNLHFSNAPFTPADMINMEYDFYRIQIPYAELKIKPAQEIKAIVLTRGNHPLDGMPRYHLREKREDIGYSEDKMAQLMCMPISYIRSMENRPVNAIAQSKTAHLVARQYIEQFSNPDYTLTPLDAKKFDLCRPEQLRALVDYIGLQREYLAALLGIGAQQLYRILRGEVQPKPIQLLWLWRFAVTEKHMRGRMLGAFAAPEKGYPKFPGHEYVPENPFDPFNDPLAMHMPLPVYPPTAHSQLWQDYDLLYE